MSAEAEQESRADATIRYDERAEGYVASCTACLAQFWTTASGVDVWEAVAGHKFGCQGRWWE